MTVGERGGYRFLTLLYHFHPIHRHLGITRAITAKSSLTSVYKLAPGLEPGTFGFSAQAVNHYATRPNNTG